MSKSDMIVLGFLNIKPMYGYEIVQFIKHRKFDVWAVIKMPSIYKALTRLKERSYISGEQVTEGNNPTRTVYSITKEGTVYFRKTLKHFLGDVNALSQDFWLTISFIYKNIEKEFLLDIINNRIKLLENHVMSHIEKFETMKKQRISQEIPFYVDILMEIGGKIHEVELEGMKALKKGILDKKNLDIFIPEEEN